MASQNVAAMFRIAVPPEEVPLKVVQWLSGLRGIQTNIMGNTVQVSYRYTPDWAIFVGILGLLFFLLGALLWFIKRTDMLTVTTTPVPGGSHVVITGRSAPAALHKLSALMATAQELPDAGPTPIPPTPA